MLRCRQHATGAIAKAYAVVATIRVAAQRQAVAIFKEEPCFGSLLELSWGMTRPLRLDTGETVLGWTGDCSSGRLP
jgi:hypothetical protein